MNIPTGHLPPLQQRLLRELGLCDHPDPEAAPESNAAPDLDAVQVREALPSL
ncbi:hypothetical protein [Streptomyces sp. NPDC000994]